LKKAGLGAPRDFAENGAHETCSAVSSEQTIIGHGVYLIAMALFLFFAPGVLRLVFALPIEFDWWNRIMALPVFNLGLFLYRLRLLEITNTDQADDRHADAGHGCGGSAGDVSHCAAARSRHRHHRHCFRSTDGLGDFNRDATPGDVAFRRPFLPHNSRDARRAPSASASSFAHMIDGCTRRT
jgi:hypothetical protein